MKITLTILFVIGLYLATSGQANKITYNNGFDKGKYIDGLKEGHWIHYYRDSSIKAEGNYKKDKKDGEWKEYYDDGGIMVVNTYEDDRIIRRVSKEYFENGQLKINRKYKKTGKGTVVTRFEDGNVEEKSEYDNGHPVGTSEKYWPNRQLLWKKEYDKEGNPISIREYYQNGKLMRTADYDKTVSGSEITYGEKGNLLDVTKLLNNKLVLEEHYYENGKLKKSVAYSPDKGVDFRLSKSYDSDGLLMQIDTVIDVHLTGKAVYTKDRIEYYKYANNRYDGKFISYYKNDKNHTIAEEGYYKNGAKVGEWKSYYPNARLQFQGSYIYDTILKQGGFATGTHKYYFEDGSDEKVEYYEIQKVASAARNTLVNKSTKIGTWITYNSNKTIGEKTSYANGLRNGPYELFDGTGHLKLKRTFKDDHFVGIEEEYYDNGKISQLVTRNEHGYKNGPTKAFFPNGNPKEISNYTEGRQEGLYETFYENGKPQTKGFYEFSLKTGKWSSWFEDGSLFTETLYDTDEPTYSMTYYYRDGKQAAFIKGNFYDKKITAATVFVDGETIDVLDHYKIDNDKTFLNKFELEEFNGSFMLSLSYYFNSNNKSSISTTFPLADINN